MADSLKDFFYDFPEDLIAKFPAQPRDSSRLMVLHRSGAAPEHRIFHDITEYFRAGDILVLNDSKVFPARLLLPRKGGGKQEILLIRPTANDSPIWQVIVNHAKQVRLNQSFDFDGLRLTILDDDGPERLARVECDGDLFAILEHIGHVPLPPYLRRSDVYEDRLNYQTVIARHAGSVAAPTAALHFTEELLQKLRDQGVIVTTLTLHVGPGTFLPVRTENIDDHQMHAEFFSLNEETCSILNAARAQNRRITAVGTTTTRVLETLALRATDLSNLGPSSGMTDLFIRPGFEFKIVQRFITNFHQPQSTLLMLVSAFVGRERILASYREAIKLNYRLFSYGDAMLIE